MTDPSAAPSSNGSNGTLADAPVPAKKTKRKDTDRQAQVPSSTQDVVTYEVHCVGITPLKMDNFPDQDKIDYLIKKKNPPKDLTTPLGLRCVKKIYRASDGSGLVVLESRCLMACLNNAARQIKLGKKGQLATAKDSKLFAALTMNGLEFPFIFPPGKNPLADKPFASPDTDSELDDTSPWQVDISRGVGKTGIANAIIRPMFPKWGFKAKFTVAYKNLEGLTPAHIRDLFQIAGTQIGLLSHNPSHKGPFGCFVVKSFTEVEGINELEAADAE